jgi:hypothetical protein
MEQPTGYKEGACYCIDMHSRTGYSGSPVFVFRTPGSSLEWMVTGKPVEIGSAMCGILGIHWGQFKDEKPIKSRKKKQQESHLPTGHEEYIEENSGMTCVIPAWRIMELLNCDQLVQQRERVEAARQK